LQRWKKTLKNIDGLITYFQRALRYLLLLIYYLQFTGSKTGVKTLLEGGSKMKKYIEYVIQPTDSVVGIAKRFGVKLYDLVGINPHVCTLEPQMGLVLKVPVDHLEVPVTVLSELDGPSEVVGSELILPDGSLLGCEIKEEHCNEN
jgi:hypothetical protein